MPKDNIEFRELMNQIRGGSEEAAWELVERYGDQIQRAVRRSLNQRLRSKYDSVDFVQLVWSSFFRTKGQVDRFDRPEELAAFLITMARNKVGMEVRRRLSTKKYNVMRETSLEQQNSTIPLGVINREPAPIDIAIAREQWDRIMDNQPGQYRRFVELRLQGKTHQEIAQEVGVAECTVRRFFKKLSRETLA